VRNQAALIKTACGAIPLLVSRKGHPQAVGSGSSRTWLSAAHPWVVVARQPLQLSVLANPLSDAQLMHHNPPAAPGSPALSDWVRIDAPDSSDSFSSDSDGDDSTSSGTSRSGSGTTGSDTPPHSVVSLATSASGGAGSVNRREAQRSQTPSVLVVEGTPAPQRCRGGWSLPFTPSQSQVWPKRHIDLCGAAAILLLPSDDIHTHHHGRCCTNSPCRQADTEYKNWSFSEGNV